MYSILLSLALYFQPSFKKQAYKISPIGFSFGTRLMGANLFLYHREPLPDYYCYLSSSSNRLMAIMW